MEAATLYWTKLAAIGQVLGAIATFAAVVVALVANSAEKGLRVRVNARFGLLIDTNGQTPVMIYEVENVGLRHAVVNGMHWTTGIANHLHIVPGILGLRSAFQLPDYEWPINQNFPWRLAPGESRSTHIRKDEFIEQFAEPRQNDLFRKFFWQNRPRLFRHRVGVAVNTRRKVVFGKVDPEITAALEAAYRG